MKLTLWNRIKLCFEILTVRSGHKHTAQEKILSTFKRGYSFGLLEGCRSGEDLRKLKETLAGLPPGSFVHSYDVYESSMFESGYKEEEMK